MYPQELTYRPQGGVAHVSKESDVRMKMLPLHNLQRISEIAKEDCLSGLTMN
jgi:hypothetical protein